ncbi:hypothetical protein F6W70_15415 [Microbacterium maritypicum]|uniref:Uncharacterized protein n=1 Tax=Microbacterium maritypicum TaxID=33918 RepID=A0AAD3X1W4_MICMQ|nr:hypothetical protein [Microbacterium liquefaciens]KAB1883960.1 hypothetical protein F6W70_15415 [Microbacterium liquefaciens]
MPTLSTRSRALRARLAQATRQNTDPAALAAVRQEFYASTVVDHLSSKLAEAPVLTRAQYDELHAVIRRHQLTGGHR